MTDVVNADCGAVAFVVSLAFAARDPYAPRLLAQLIEHYSIDAEWAVTPGAPKEKRCPR